LAGEQKSAPARGAGGVVESLPVDSLREALPLLRRPFTPEAVRFKVQSQLGDAAGALIVAYIDARLVIERLNLVVGSEWYPHYKPVDGTKLMWCQLSLFGSAPRADVGESSEGMSKDLVSDSLKRAAVHFGVGVSIYALPQITLWAGSKHLEVRAKPKRHLVLTEAGHTGLRDGYRKWLEESGHNFGEPLNHGDVAGAVVDEETLPEEDFAPSFPPALSDVESGELREQILLVYEVIRGRDPKRVPPGRFNEWLRAAEWSHDELRRLLGSLSEIESEQAAAA
jgi:hypothetical protein